MRAALAGAACGLLALGAQAGLLGHCTAPPEQTAEQQDRLLRFADVIRAELEQAGQPLAIVARSGLDLARFGLRYSHAGFSLRAHAQTPWSVRQLYYDCDERRPRIFDQGLAGFVLGLDDPAAGHVSALLLPAEAAAMLDRAVRDDGRALQLLASTYSANAHAFGQRYQNCNQWVVEMLATAWGGGDAAPWSRAAAQAWLHERGYRPTEFHIATRPWLWLALALPWLHLDDHPPQDIERGELKVSMPASIEGFVRATVPGAQRLEFCHRGARMVVRRGWEPLSADCVAQPGDRLVAFD